MMKRILQRNSRLVRLVALTIALLLCTYASAAQKSYDVPAGDSPYFGPADAAVTVIEFIDYQ